MNKSKMVGTVGPSSYDYDIIKNMILSGVDVIRLNMTYASFDFAKSVIFNVRKIDYELNRETGLMIDTIGPVIRIGDLEEKKIKLEKDKHIRIVFSETKGNKDIIYMNEIEILKHIGENEFIYLNNGEVKLEVLMKDNETLLCKILNNGFIVPYSTVNIPNLDIAKSFISKRDKEIIKFAVDMKVDYLALSLVRDEMDVLEVNDLLISYNDSDLQILSKIESKVAVEQIERIVNVSDGIIVSRNDIGIEMGYEKVPIIQKEILKLVKEKEKVVIIATDILNSMIDNVVPAKSEVSDISNAIFDGTDAFILGSETAIGSFPVETVDVLNRIIDQIESDINYNSLLLKINRKDEVELSKAVAYSSVDSANRLKAKAIVCFTNDGKIAKDISNFRPSCPLIAISKSFKVIRGLSMYYSVVPINIEMFDENSNIESIAKAYSKRELGLREGDIIVIASSNNKSNYMKIIEI